MKKTTPMRAGGRVPVAPGPRPPVAPMRAGGRVPVAPGPRPPVAPMRSGGLAGGHKAADGIAQRGKTKARQVRMNAGGKC